MAAVFRRTPPVDRGDLQGNILCGYGGSFRNARYLFVRVGDAAAGRRWLGELAGEVTDARTWPGPKPQSTLNVALSYDGLEALGLPGSVLAGFPPEFRDGMAARAGLLGDTGDSDPERWEPGLRAGEPHVLVILTARDARVIARVMRRLRRRIVAAPGLELVHSQPAALIGGTEDPALREHFGFADGFSQPAIRGDEGPETRPGMGTPRRRGGWSELAPGEFVLGYPGEDGLLERAPPAPLGRSGSFMVWRKLQQHVDRFNAFLREEARKDLPCLRGLNGADAAVREEVLAASIVGRWRDGTALMRERQPRPARPLDRAEVEAINDFRYESDPDGLRCPLGAHVRRANPRDALGWEGRLTRRHRIIRRGMPYGPPGDDERQRGLVFICYQASIRRQFEVIQARWLEDGDAFWLGGERDLIGQASRPRPGAPGETMTIQGRPPTFVTRREPFVTMRGGAYLFTPGIGALRALAAAYWR